MVSTFHPSQQLYRVDIYKQSWAFLKITFMHYTIVHNCKHGQSLPYKLNRYSSWCGQLISGNFTLLANVRGNKACSRYFLDLWERSFVKKNKEKKEKKKKLLQFFSKSSRTLNMFFLNYYLAYYNQTTLLPAPHMPAFYALMSPTRNRVESVSLKSKCMLLI